MASLGYRMRFCFKHHQIGREGITFFSSVTTKVIYTPTNNFPPMLLQAIPNSNSVGQECACMYTHKRETETENMRENFSTHFQVVITEESQGRNLHNEGTWRLQLMQRPWKNAVYWLAPCG